MGKEATRATRGIAMSFAPRRCSLAPEMDVSGKVAIVTGGASGIGRALALAFADQGAGGVIVADLDADGAEVVAKQIGDRAVAVGGDVATADGVDALVGAAESEFGPVDIFCANAGVAVGTGVETPDAEWELSFDVNIRAHILAARRLVPGWLERGEGYFLSTASAAGLLTQIGSAPYAVTKHAALAFAEWLAVTYGDRGLKVSCICPMGVDTPLLNEGLAKPGGDEALGARVVEAAGELLQPEEVADAVMDALRDERFLVLPHPEVLTFLRRKADDYDRWLAGMRRLQRAVR
jgi:NAD(P)-dependent dehydrogenase (short-subunit alcohol dehydrogenase family)